MVPEVRKTSAEPLRNLALARHSVNSEFRILDRDEYRMWVMLINSHDSSLICHRADMKSIMSYDYKLWLAM